MVTLDPHALSGIASKDGRELRVMALDFTTLRATHEGPPVPVATRETISLRADVAPFEAVVIESRAADTGVAVTYTIADLPLATMRELLRTVDRLAAQGLATETATEAAREERETVVDLRRIRETARALFANRCPARMLDPAGRTLFSLVPETIHPEATYPLQWLAKRKAEGEPAGDVATIEVTGFLSLFRFVAGEVFIDEHHVRTAVPSAIERIRRRATPRWALGRTAADGAMTISFRHPRYPELLVRRPVRDVTFDGLAFQSDFVADALYAGLRIEKVTLEWRAADGGREDFEFGALVTHALPHEGRDHVGVRLLAIDDDAAKRWRHRIHALECVGAHTDGTRAEALWDLYDRAGYFSLSGKSTPDFAHLREPFARVGPCIARAPELGCQVVIASPRGAEASMTLLKIYAESAFIYQLARRPPDAETWHERRRTLRDVHLAVISRMMRDLSRAHWLVAWVQDTARFSRLVYHDVPARYIADGRAAIRYFRAMEGSVGQPSAGDRSVPVSPATSGERGDLLDMLQRTRPGPFLEAHDLVPERFDLAAIAAAWRSVSLLRERQVLVARAADGSRTAAVVEIADDGLHLFGLMDVVRIFPVDGQPLTKDVARSLLAAARDWYRERNKRTFTYYLEGDDVAGTSEDGFIDLGGAYLTVLHRDLLPELLEQVYHVTAPRDVPPLPGSSSLPPRGES